MYTFLATKCSFDILTFFIGCVLYHYGLTEFKVELYHKRSLTFADGLFFKYYTVIFGVSRGKSKYSYIVTQCVLTRNTLALGALTQLVWARGTIIVIIRCFKLQKPYVCFYSPWLAPGETEM